MFGCLGVEDMDGQAMLRGYNPVYARPWPFCGSKKAFLGPLVNFRCVYSLAVLAVHLRSPGLRKVTLNVGVESISTQYKFNENIKLDEPRNQNVSLKGKGTKLKALSDPSPPCPFFKYPLEGTNPLKDRDPLSRYPWDREDIAHDLSPPRRGPKYPLNGENLPTDNEKEAADPSRPSSATRRRSSPLPCLRIRFKNFVRLSLSAH